MCTVLAEVLKLATTEFHSNYVDIDIRLKFSVPPFDGAPEPLMLRANFVSGGDECANRVLFAPVSRSLAQLLVCIAT